MGEEYIDEKVAQELVAELKKQFTEMPLKDELLMRALEATVAPDISSIYVETPAAAQPEDKPKFYLRRMICNAGVKYVDHHEPSKGHLLMKFLKEHIHYKDNTFEGYSSENITERLEENKRLVGIINDASKVFPYSLLCKYERVSMDSYGGERKVAIPKLIIPGISDADIKIVHLFEDANKVEGRKMGEDVDFIIKMVEHFRIPPRDL